MAFCVYCLHSHILISAAPSNTLTDRVDAPQVKPPQLTLSDCSSESTSENGSSNSNGVSDLNPLAAVFTPSTPTPSTTVPSTSAGRFSYAAIVSAPARPKSPHSVGSCMPGIVSPSIIISTSRIRSFCHIIH